MLKEERKPDFKERKPDFIAFPKQDNWQNFDYNCRILDALASLLHFKSACGGMFKHKDNLYLSYNKQVNTSEKLIIAQVNQMRDFIYNGSAEQLLTLYLLLNIDYIEFIKN
ncbi:MAG: hypothetical protein RCO49_06840 [Rickettsia endosymbiont of Argas persicus]